MNTLYGPPPKWISAFEWLINSDVRRINQLEAREQRALDEFDLVKDHRRRGGCLVRAAEAVRPMLKLTRLGWEDDDYAAVRLEIQFLTVAADCEYSLQTGQPVPFGAYLPGLEHWEAITTEHDPEARAALYEKIAAVTRETIPGYPGDHAGDVADMLACSERVAPDTPKLRAQRKVRKAERVIKRTAKWTVMAVAVAVLGWVTGWLVVPGIAVLWAADEYAGAVIARTAPIWTLPRTWQRRKELINAIHSAPGACYLAGIVAMDGRRVFTTTGILVTLAAMCALYRAMQSTVSLPPDTVAEEGT